MSDYFNQFEKSTTSIKCENIPKVATAFKNAMLNYQYATNCGWYDDLVNASMVKDIFDIFNIKFEADNVNRVFIPVIENVYTHAGFKDMLKAIAPYMENGSLFFKDSYRYYTITFTDGVVTGKRRTTSDTPDNTPATIPSNTPTKSPSSTPSKNVTKSKKTKKGSKKIEFSNPTTPVTMKREDNTYTVAELVRELLVQMDAGNASKKIKVEADFLFQNEKYA